MTIALLNSFIWSRRTAGSIPVLACLLLSTLPLPAQLLTNIQSFPDRISVGDPQVASNDHKEGPKGIASADFNGDGKPDLAAGNLDGTITILISQGGGKFAAPVHLRTGAQELRSVLAVDLNGDGKPDLAAASPMDGKLLLYFNAGGGAFGAATPLEGWLGVRCLAAGDFDGDSITDLAAAGPGIGVRHFRGNGGGTFEIMGDLPRLSPLAPVIPRPVYTMRALRSRDGLRDDLLATHADSAALYILSTVPVNRSGEPPMNLARLPGWRTLASPVLLHEVQVHNAGTLLDSDGTAQPWVELLNKSAAPVNLAGWELRSESQGWVFPSVSVEPGRMLVVFLSGKNVISGMELHTSFLLKQNSKDLSLVQPGGAEANKFTLTQHSVPDVSFGLAPDLHSMKNFDIPSPGAENNAGLSSIDDVHPDMVTTLAITPREPAPGQSVTVRVTIPERPTGSSAVRNVWFSATPGLYEYHHLLRRQAPGVYEQVLPPGAFTGSTPHRVLARLRDGTGNDYTSEVHRGLDEMEVTRIALPRPGRLLPVASVPSPKVKAFEVGAIGSPSNLPGAPADLVYADDVCGVLRVHRAGPGARRFEPMPSQDVPVRGAPRDVKLADTDGDGWLDATVVLRSLDLALTFRNENGIFRATGELPTGRSPREAVMADFTGDGKPDAAVINRYSADVSILPSSDRLPGLVSLDQIYSVNGEVAGLTVKDFNGDGRDDVMQLHRASREFSIRTAGPDGILSAPVFSSMGEAPNSVATADVNNDGRLDMLTANLGRVGTDFGRWFGTGSISVRLAKPDGTYDPQRTFEAPTTPSSMSSALFAISVADFDNDGNMDVVAGLFDCRVGFFRGDGTGKFTYTYAVFFVYESRVMVTGDFDQDGDTDIAGAGYSGDVVTLENRGATTAAGWLKRTYPRPAIDASGTGRIALTNVDGDADPDLVVGTGRGVAIYSGKAGMDFMYSTELSQGTSFPVGDALTVDLDGDGKLEMVASCRTASCINILTQNAAGEFLPVIQADVPSGRYLASGDLDGDGKPDLVGTGDVLWTALSSRPPQIAAPGSTVTNRPQSSDVVINEVLSQNTRLPITSDNGLKTDFVEIFNGGAATANLAGWKVRLQSTQAGAAVDQTWTLPAITAGAKAHAIILFSAEPGTAHTGFTLPAEGGTLTLLKPDNSEADRVDYPQAQENVSWSRYLDGHPSFHADRIPSPGMSNLDNGTVPPEVKLTAPSPATMVAGQPLTFTAKGRDDSGIISLSLLWNRLDAPLSEPQRIVLYDDGMHQDAGAVDGIFSGQLASGLPAGAEVQFYLEAVDLSGEVLLLPDSAELVAAGEAPVAWSFSLTTTPPLEITEVTTNNVTGLRDDLGGYADYVKVRNNGGAPVDMSGILLAKSPLSAASAVYSFPQGLTLPSAGEVTIFADNNPSEGALHAPFTLDAGGDDLALLAMTPSGARQWIHSLTVPASLPDSSYRLLPGTTLHAVIAATADLTKWSGISWDANGHAMATVHFMALAGSSYHIEGDAPGAPEGWTLLQVIPGDDAVHTVTWPVAEMAALRVVPVIPSPSLRLDAVPVTATSAMVFGEAPRASGVIVYYGLTDGGISPAAWTFSNAGTGGTFEIALRGTAASNWVLTADTMYYYRVRASNAAGEVWSPAGTNFRTLPATIPVPLGLQVIDLNATDVRVNVIVMPAPPAGSTVTLLAGTVDAFATVAAWQRSVAAPGPANSGTAMNSWTVSLTGLARETTYFIRAVVKTPGDVQTVSAERLTIRMPDAKANLVMNLRLSEIMYHPSPATPAEFAAGFEEPDFEFIELHNASDESMDLSGLWFADGLDFDFPASGAPVIPPGGYAVIAANPHAFAMRYGASIPLAGWTLHPFRKARLSNSAERITLQTADGTFLFSVSYTDRPETTDGRGFSLEYRGLTDSSHLEAWQDYLASRLTGGSPGWAGLPLPTQTFSTWQPLYFTAGQISNQAFSGMSADPDKDGLTNFAEYACGTRPLIADSTDVLSIRDGGVTGGMKTLSLTFPVNPMALEAVFDIQGTDLTLPAWNVDAFNVSHYAYVAGAGSSILQGALRQTSRNYLSSAVLTPGGQQILFTIAVQIFPNTWLLPGLVVPNSRLFRLQIRRPSP